MLNHHSLAVIIPSWAKLSVQMQAETGAQYPVFIPVRGLPLWVHIMACYQHISLPITFVVVLPDDEPPLDLSLLAHTDIKNATVKTVTLANSRHIADTVIAGLKPLTENLITENHPPEKNSKVCVHMADTLISNLSDVLTSPLDTIYIEQRPDLYRWTSIKLQKNGQVNIQEDRNSQADIKNENICTGVFIFSNAALLKKSLQQAILENKDMDPFFTAIETYSTTQPMQFINSKDWRDFGHVDSYYEARLNFHNLRHFNELSYDANRGVVTKRSQSVEAFRHQVRWFKQMPDELSYFLPKIYDMNDGNEPFISMEFLSIPTLNDLFVSNRLELGAWNDVARKIEHIITLFKKYEFQSALAKNIAIEMYVTKTKNRLHDFMLQIPQASEYWVTIDNKKLALPQVLTSLEAYCKKYDLLSLDKLTPIHGDLCFSNILYDLKSRQVKLIDPRGEFGIPGIYGDTRYDKAKMLHSYSGCYDFIVSDQFMVEITSDNELKCTINVGDYQQKIEQIIDRILFADEQQKTQAQAIEALLFLSMLPLHSDKPNRQMALLCIGLTKFAKLWMDAI